VSSTSVSVPAETTLPVRPAVDSPGITGELTLVVSELARADAKANTLLAVTTVAATIALTVLTGRPHLPGAAQTLGWAATGLLAAAVLLLTRAVRPNLRGCHGFMAWAATDPAHLPDALGHTAAPSAGDAHRLVALSRLARTKFRLIRGGVDLLAAAVIVFAAAGVAGALTGAVTR
jgi:hypothetical protein